MAVCVSISERFSADSINEAFVAAAAQGDVSKKGFLKWCLTRMENPRAAPNFSLPNLYDDEEVPTDGG